MDDTLISGPECGLENVDRVVHGIVKGKADAMLGFQGLLSRVGIDEPRLGRIANVTASTTLSHYTHKQLVGSVEASVKAGFDGVAAHINLSSDGEPDMLRILGQVQRECEVYQMPLLVITYPRKETVNGVENYLDLKNNNPAEYLRLLRHGVRLAADLGADVIKTQYTGDPETFKKVAAVSYDVPVLIAGGPRVPEEQALQVASDAVSAGARGVCFGRQVHLSDDIPGFLRRLRHAMADRCVSRRPVALVTAESGRH